MSEAPESLVIVAEEMVAQSATVIVGLVDVYSIWQLSESYVLTVKPLLGAAEYGFLKPVTVN